MNITLNYTYGGFVPPKPMTCVCIYITPEGEPSFGVAKSEYNIDTGKWQWNAALGETFGNAPPFAYLEVDGSIEDVLQVLKKDGYAVYNIQY